MNMAPSVIAMMSAVVNIEAMNRIMALALSRVGAAMESIAQASGNQNVEERQQ
jgi:hypothetical protein